jgi:GNAT superfamily N-acetyltransferase
MPIISWGEGEYRAELTVTSQGTPPHRHALTDAFRFFRTHAGENYSSNALMAIVRASDAEQTVSRRDLRAPLALTVGLPAAFDPLTETKTGGTIAQAIILPRGRTLLAVHGNHRMQGLGAALLGHVCQTERHVRFYIAATNTRALRFLQQYGLSHVATTTQGTLMFALDGDEVL